MIVARMPRPSQQPSQRPFRETVATPSRDPRYDVTTVSGRRYNNATERARTNWPAERARIQPEVNACWTSGFAGDGTGCRRQPLGQEKWTSKIRNDAGVPLPVANGRRSFTQQITGKALPMNGDGRIRGQRTNCDRQPVSRGVSQNIVKSHTLRNAVKPRTEVEISRFPQRDGETSAAAAENDASLDEEVTIVGGDGSTTSSSRNSIRTSVTSYDRDDVTQVRVRSAGTSGVFSRMSTEAQQACFDVRRPRTTADAASDQPETETSARADDPTSGLVGGRQTTTACERNNLRRRRGRYATQETAYNVFEPRCNEAAGVAPANGASTYRVLAVQQRAGNSRAVGNFRITSAAYDSRFAEMAAAAAASRRVSNNCVSDDNDYGYEDDDDDDDIVDSRAASVAKCLQWLRTQRNQYKPR